jgi:hypothetical protein
MFVIRTGARVKIRVNGNPFPATAGVKIVKNGTVGYPGSLKSHKQAQQGDGWKAGFRQIAKRGSLIKGDSRNEFFCPKGSGRRFDRLEGRIGFDFESPTILRLNERDEDSE